MAEQREPGAVNRRKFLSGAAIAGALVVGPDVAAAETGEAPAKRASPHPAQVSAETVAPVPSGSLVVDRPGSDFMVDVLKALHLDYVATMPGSSFRGLHESIINYGGNRAPELLTCLHEEVSVGMAHGYAKVAGKPMAIMAHSTVGLQHAAMAVYNAWCDRVPVYMIAGNLLDAARRRPFADWFHSAQDPAVILRDCTKWDDQPASLQHAAESFVRAYKIATTPPMGPVLLVLDSDMQEQAMDGAAPAIPHLAMPAPPRGDSGAVLEAARLLAAAENPVIIADRLVRTVQGMAHLVELAELLGAPVIDKLSRLNFPTDHDLNLTFQSASLLKEADVIVGLEMVDFWGTVNQFRDTPAHDLRSVLRPDAKLIGISMSDLYQKANYQDFQRYLPVDVAIAADGEATLPDLVEAVRHLMAGNRRSAAKARRGRWSGAHRAMRAAARRDAAYAWDASPVSTARLYADLWTQVKGEDWALVSDPVYQGNWPHRLWNFEKPYQFIGGAGGYGIGYGAPAAIGAALAHREHGRFAINIQSDGDLMCTPSVLWTAAHHRIPVLTVMHNNRAYHQEFMHLQRMAAQRQRGIERAAIGTVIDQPAISYAKLAESMGVEAIGPVTDPADYAPALRRAIAVVKSGAPALIDVVGQPR